jgi:hypothetical protein
MDMTDDQSNYTSNPDAALKAISRSRAAVYEKVSGSWRYDIVVSLVVGSVVASAALQWPWDIIYPGLGVVVLFNLGWETTKRRGVLVTGTPPGTRWVIITLGLMAVSYVLLIASFGLNLKQRVGLLWAPLLLGILVTLGFLASWRLWLRAYRAAMHPGPEGRIWIAPKNAVIAVPRFDPLIQASERLQICALLSATQEWYGKGFPDTKLRSFSVLCLIVSRRLISYRGMATLAIVKDLNVFKNFLFGFFPGPIPSIMCQLDL